MAGGLLQTVVCAVDGATDGRGGTRRGMRRRTKGCSLLSGSKGLSAESHDTKAKAKVQSWAGCGRSLCPVLVASSSSSSSVRASCVRGVSEVSWEDYADAGKTSTP